MGIAEVPTRTIHFMGPLSAGVVLTAFIPDSQSCLLVENDKYRETNPAAATGAVGLCLSFAAARRFCKLCQKSRFPATVVISVLLLCGLFAP